MFFFMVSGNIIFIIYVFFFVVVSLSDWGDKEKDKRYITKHVIFFNQILK